MSSLVFYYPIKPESVTILRQASQEHSGGRCESKQSLHRNNNSKGEKKNKDTKIQTGKTEVQRLGLRQKSHPLKKTTQARSTALAASKQDWQRTELSHMVQRQSAGVSGDGAGEWDAGESRGKAEQS